VRLLCLEDEWQRIAQRTDAYAIAVGDWRAMVARVRDGERIDAATCQASLDALNLAYAELTGRSDVP
jgi:hypothetical protein